MGSGHYLRRPFRHSAGERVRPWNYHEDEPDLSYGTNAYANYAEQLRAAAAKSNEALARLGADIQWVESFVAADKTFCAYLAKDEAVIRKHAEMSGFPATTISEIRTVIDPTTERAG